MKSKQKNITVRTLKRRNFLIIFGISAATILLVVWFVVFCRVKTITVKNNLTITTETILSAAKIKENRHLFSIDLDKVESAVETISPYIRSVTAERNIPSEITITVEEYSADYYIVLEDICYLLSDSLFVLEEIPLSESETQTGARLTLPEIKEIQVGSTIVFEEKENMTYILNLLSFFGNSTLSDTITVLRLAEKADIRAEIDTHYEIRFASANGLEKKLSLCEESIAYLRKNMYGVKGILHAETTDEVTFELTGVAE